MKRMAEEFFASSPVLALPVVAMLLFFAVFTLVVIRTMRTQSAAFDGRAALPLEEDTHV